MSANKVVLVIGASGFLGGHLTRQLVEQGYQVRVLIRQTSNTAMLEGLSVEKHFGDVLDIESLKNAMSGCDYVFHSAINTSAWLIDSGPLYQTNLIGTINAVRAAKSIAVEKFVMTSSLCTIGKPEAGAIEATEDNHLADVDIKVEYIRTRKAAEDYVLNESRENGFPGIACCVANTYGPDDIGPTPHGDLVRQVVRGKLPFYFDAHSACVGVVDAARALILAAERGVPGERYIVSSDYISNKSLFESAAQYAGSKPPGFAVPEKLLRAICFVVESIARLRGKDSKLNKNSLDMIYVLTWPLSNKKAAEQLGWHPRPLEASIKSAVNYYQTGKATQNGTA